MFFIMQYMRKRSSSVRTEWLLPLRVNIHDNMKEMILSSSFKSPTKNPSLSSEDFLGSSHNIASCWSLLAHLCSLFGFLTQCISALILPATQTWRNRFVALSAPSTRLRLLRNHSPNFLSDVFKCDLQNTQTAPLAAVCTPTIKLVQQNHQKLETSNVCARKNLHSVFRLSFFSSSLSLWFCLLSLFSCFWA